MFKDVDWIFNKQKDNSMIILESKNVSQAYLEMRTEGTTNHTKFTTSVTVCHILIVTLVTV